MGEVIQFPKDRWIHDDLLKFTPVDSDQFPRGITLCDDCTYIIHNNHPGYKINKLSLCSDCLDRWNKITDDPTVCV